MYLDASTSLRRPTRAAGWREGFGVVLQSCCRDEIGGYFVWVDYGDFALKLFIVFVRWCES